MAEDDRGQTIFWSGAVEDDGTGPVDKGAHFYRAFLVDQHGNEINKRNTWAARAVVYARAIPPGAADTVHYRLNIPEDVGDTISLRAKLNYRKFSWWNTQFAFRRAASHPGRLRPEPTMRLYRNLGDGTFADVTEAAALNVPLYGMGFAADYDNDRDRDVVVTGYLGNLFFINNEDGTFTEATASVGLRQGKWGAAAAFVDYDRDGFLDLGHRQLRGMGCRQRESA
jgi:hypothetical protein